MNFTDINKAALAGEYPRYLFPQAKQVGRELQCGDIQGSPGRSFCVNLDSGAWIDNGTGQRGGDIVSLVAERDGLPQGEAAKRLSDELNLTTQPAGPKAMSEAPTSGEPAYTYPYYGPDGMLAFEVLRYEKPGHKKAIRARGTYNQKLLYNAADALQYNTVFVVEGEKCVDALKAPIVGLSPVCNPGGAGKWLDEHSQALKGKKVVILPDNDEAGEKHAAQVARSVFPLAASVKIVRLPGLPPKGDVYDWLEAGNDPLQIADLMDAAPVWTPLVEVEEPKEEGKSKLKSYGARMFLSKEIPERDFVLWPIIPDQGLVMLYAKRGIGKTFVALSIAIAASTGGNLFYWKAERPRRTLYIDGEMPARTMQDRMRALEAGAGCRLEDEWLSILTPDMQEDGHMPNLSDYEGQLELADIVKDFDFIVVDNLATLCRGGKENEADSWAKMQEWLLFLRRTGKSVMFVHHAGKSGDQLGTSHKEIILDTVIKLTQEDDYMVSEGAKFTVTLTKARGITGPEAEPFEAMLVEDPHTKGLTWEYARKADRDIQRVKELLDEGMTQRQIAEVMTSDGGKWSAAKVNRFIRDHNIVKTVVI